MSDGIIGRGEERTVEILKHLFPRWNVIQQMNIRSLIPAEEYSKLGPEYNKHRHDIVLKKGDETIVIEVNYKHGNIAESKWHNVYKPQLEAAGNFTCTIEDSQCVSLFDLKSGIHKNTWQDWIDVIQSLKQDGILERED